MKNCNVGYCTKESIAKGYCKNHYEQVRRHGKVLITHKSPINQRLEENIIISKSGCWEWQKYRNSQGYGKITVGGKQEAAHRVSYRTHVGEIPKDMFVCHSCDNPPCINPSHLFLGTPSDNMQDKMKKGRCYTPKGEDHAFSKITNEQCLQIYKRIGEKENHDKIADDFGIKRQTVTNISTGKNWSWLTKQQRTQE